MIRILFTGGGGAGNEALWRLLSNRYILHFGDADPNTINPNIPEDRRHQLPWATDPNFIHKIAKICQRLNIDLLVPSVDEELLELSRNANELAPTRLFLPVTEYIETMLDKLSMIRSLSEKGISVPISQALVDDLNDIHFPCISKPRSGRGSRDVRVLNSIADAMLLKLTLGDRAEKIMVQDKIEGMEYTVQMLADDTGQLRAIVPVRIDIKSGITIRAETEAEPHVIAACHSIHQAIPTSGCYNIQLMHTTEGKVLPFEINPRISTTFCLVVAAGVDPFAIFFKQYQGNDIIPFDAGIKLRRHWTNFFLKQEVN
jgi:carbamoyl-phosphate synthase large subunit